MTKTIQRSIVFSKVQNDYLLKRSRALGITPGEVARRILDRARLEDNPKAAIVELRHGGARAARWPQKEARDGELAAD